MLILQVGFCVFFANLYFINFSAINMYNLLKNCCSNNMLKIVKHFSPFQVLAAQERYSCCCYTGFFASAPQHSLYFSFFFLLSLLLYSLFFSAGNIILYSATLYSRRYMWMVLRLSDAQDVKYEDIPWVFSWLICMYPLEMIFLI